MQQQEKYVSLETAKKLKEAGWDTPTENRWSKNRTFDWHLVTGPATEDRPDFGCFDLPAPDASEIFNELPNGSYAVKGLAFGNYLAGTNEEMTGGETKDNSRWNKNPAEALALLWLEINSKTP